MQGKKFTYVVLTSDINNIPFTLGHEKIHEEMEGVFSPINRTVSGSVQGNMSAQKRDFTSKNYFDNFEILEQTLRIGIARGTWRVNGYYTSDNEMDTK